MAGERYMTTDHDRIRRWVDERNGKPAHVTSTGGGDDAGLIRIDFPGYSGGGSLEEISWDAWLEKFEENNLVFLYQETLADGERSNFNKLVSRETADENESAEWVGGRREGTAEGKR